jgi:hypothetical protein
MNALSGNAWTAGKGKGSGGGDRGASQAAPVQAERHVPVKNYNAAEVKDFLKKSKSSTPLNLQLTCSMSTGRRKL